MPRATLIAGVRVSAPLGGFLPDEDGQATRSRARLFGNIEESVENRKWRVRFDDGQTLDLASSRLRREVEGAGMIAQGGEAAAAVHAAQDDEENPEFDPDDELDEEPDGEVDASHDLEPDLDKHAKAQADAKAEIAALEGDKVVVVNGPKTKLVSVTWTVVNSNSPEMARDDFGDKLVGTKRTRDDPDPKCKQEMRVLRHHRIDDTEREAFLKLFLHLYPGTLEEHVDLVNTGGIARFGSAWKTLTVQEWIVFLGTLVAASLYKDQRGRKLWATERVGFIPPPDFGKFMLVGRHTQIIAVAHHAFADLGSCAEHPWAMFTPAVKAFNENRRENIIQRPYLLADESMSAMKPRATSTGRGCEHYPPLPNLSFIKRKPEPFGTEFKDVADAMSGILLYLEIAEGKDRMRSKKFCKELGACGACALRITLGTIGAKF